MKRLITVVALLFLLSGCRTEPSVGEQVVVTGLAVAERDGIWTVSVQAVEALRTAGSLSEQSEPATAVYTASGASVAEALQAFLNETGKRTYILQNRILVLEESLCRRRSLYEVLDYFIRRGEGRALVDVMVCRGDPADLLSITTESDTIPAEYVSELLEEGWRSTRCVRTRLLDVERASSGMYSVALPLLTVQDGTPRLMGTALFREGLLVGDLTAQETAALQLAAGGGEHCYYTVDGTTFLLKDIHARITAFDGSRYRVSVSAASTAVEGAYSASRLRQVCTALEADIESALTRTARCGSDPLALSRRTAAARRAEGITQEVARRALPTATVTATVTLTHTDSGLLTAAK